MLWPITPEMSLEIREVYRTKGCNGEVRALAKKLKLPRWKITHHAIKQGWIAKKRKDPDWTEKELKILEHNAHKTPENIHLWLKKAGFDRSITGIVLKRKRMRFLKNLKGQTATSLAECFGVDIKCVTRWIGLGYLQAKRRGTDRTERQGGDMWFIKDRAVRSFIVNYLDEIDIRKVDKYWFVDMLVEDRSQEPGVRSQEMEDRRQETEDRSQEPEDRSQEPEDRSQESGVRSQETEEEIEKYSEMDRIDIAEIFVEAQQWA